MKRIVGSVLSSVVFAAVSAVRADLTTDINRCLADKGLTRTQIGIEVLKLGGAAADTRVIYERNAAAPRTPASNLKLATTATALDQLGADFTFKTYLARRDNDVALIGDGDPTLGDAEMLKKVGWDVTTVFKSWADALRKQGVTEVHDVCVDDSIFDQDYLPANWPADQAHKRYVAEVGGVNLNANCLDFYVQLKGAGQTVGYHTDPPTNYATIGNSCVGGNDNAIWLSRRLGTNEIVLRGQTDTSNSEPASVTIHDPPMFAATVLSETLAANGIRMTGQVRRDLSVRGALNLPAAAADPKRWTAVAVHSTPLAVVLNRANKDSMNLYAEALCKRVGAAATGQSGSWASGTAAVSSMLESIGVSKGEFSLDDGCGLSKKNGISPNALARVLAHEFFGKNHDTFQSSLAVAGVDGTFEKRFREGDLKGRVFGKSGYVVNVSCCSGYLHARDGQWYAFSIMMNGLPEGPAPAKAVQEKVVAAIDANARDNGSRDHGAETDSGSVAGTGTAER